MPEQPSNQDRFTAEANQLELEKRRLEIEKLRAEIKHESLAWWKRPGYIGGITPLVLALIGVFSAWSTGFFDTQRAKLKSEVKNLQLQKENLQNQNSQLASANADIQSTVDQSYLSLKLAVANANYALGHLRATGPSLSEAERQSVEAATQALPQQLRGLIERLLRADANAAVIVPITEQELQSLNKRLASIPASKWALELQPEIGPAPMMRSPDGKIYDPVGRKFYDTLKDFEKR
jgi:hypothetical protein